MSESTSGPPSASDLELIEAEGGQPRLTPAEADRAEASLAAGSAPGDRPPPAVWERIEETLRREGRITHEARPEP